MSTVHEYKASTWAVSWPQELDEHGRNLREPWPEYVAIYKNDIPEALATLKRLYVDEDRRLVPFLLSFPHVDETIPTEQRDAYWLSGMPLLLLELVSSDRWYLMLRDTRFNIENLDSTTLDTVWQWNLVLYITAVFSENVQGLYCDCEALESYCARFPTLWMALWRFRTIVMSRQFTKLLESQGLQSQVERVLHSYYCLYRYVDIRNSEPVLRSYAAHVAIHLWHDFGGVRQTHMYENAFLITSMLEKRSPEAQRVFFKEVLSNITGTDHIGDTLCQMMNTDTKTSFGPEALWYAVKMVALHLMAGPTKEIAATHMESLLMSLALGFQRFECNGDLNHPTLTRPLMAQNVLHAIHELCHVNWDKTADIVKEHVYQLHFVHVITLNVVWAMEEPHLYAGECLFMFIAIYTQIGEGGLLTLDINAKKRWAYLRRVLQVYWLPSLHDMRNLLRKIEATGVTEAEDGRITCLDEMIYHWRKIGRLFRLSERSRENDQNLTAYVSLRNKLRGCFSTECPCYGHEPLHGTRHVCRGCWQAFYCGKRCQKKDWEAGHRNICRRRNRFQLNPGPGV